MLTLRINGRGHGNDEYDDCGYYPDYYLEEDQDDDCQDNHDGNFNYDYDSDYDDHGDKDDGHDHGGLTDVLLTEQCPHCVHSVLMIKRMIIMMKIMARCDDSNDRNDGDHH